MSDLEKNYGLNYPEKSLAIANDFVVTTNKACFQLGKALKPFCIYADEEQKKYNVIDFSKFQGMLDANRTLEDEIVDYRDSVYSNYNMYFDKEEMLNRKLLFFDYLLSVSICYVEIPKWVTKDGQRSPSYDKFLATKNPALMGTWVNISKNEAHAKYSAKIEERQIDVNSNMIRCVKLMQGVKGNSITIPRNSFDVSEMHCVPLYMLYAFLKGFEDYLSDGILKFSYLKDNQTIRELYSTLSENILMDYYNKDTKKVAEFMSGVDIHTVQQGAMQLSSKVGRGYIKIPELGSSIYDATGVRSLNWARLLIIEKVSEAPRDYINVDLNIVYDEFINAMETMLIENPSEVSNVYSALVNAKAPSTEPSSLVALAAKYIHERDVIFSTTYARQLHKFMVGHKEWFPKYTGKPTDEQITQGVKPENIGVSVDD